MGTPTANYGFTKPTVNADSDTWGTENNASWDAVDAALHALATNIVGALGYTPLNKAGDLATNLSVQFTANPGTQGVGYLGTPINRQDNNYTFAIADCGSTVLHSTGVAHTYTIPLGSSVNFPIGTLIGIVNDTNSGALTISPAAGVSLRFAGSITAGARSMNSSTAVASLVKYSTDVWLISGVGVS